jgi:hypothetical protein
MPRALRKDANRKNRKGGSEEGEKRRKGAYS